MNVFENLPRARYEFQTILGEQPCPLCQATFAHHVECPARTSDPPSYVPCEQGGFAVEHERRPAAWKLWERCDGAIPWSPESLGPLPPPPRHCRSWSRWRWRARILVVSSLEWVLSEGTFGWHYHLCAALREPRQTLYLSAMLETFRLSKAQHIDGGEKRQDYWNRI